MRVADGKMDGMYGRDTAFETGSAVGECDDRGKFEGLVS